MAAWLRVLANPKVLKRFFKTKAGKKVLFKYGKMLLQSKLIQRLIDRFTKKNDGLMRDSKEYKKLEKEYKKLQQRVADLEARLNAAGEDKQAIETLTFTLGRTVVEMRQLLEKMQSEYLHRQQQLQVNKQIQYTR